MMNSGRKNSDQITLSLLAKNAATMCIIFRDYLRYYIQHLDELDNPPGKDTVNGAITLDSLSMDTGHSMAVFHNTWEAEVRNIITGRIPQQYVESFNTRNHFIGGTSDFPEYSVLPEFFRDLIDELCEIKNQLAVVEQIISECPEDAWTHDGEVAYEMKFDEFQSELYINDFKIRRCNVKSDFGDAIYEALRNADNSARVSDNFAQNISSLKMPRQLRQMMFRVGGGLLKITPKITFEQLKKKSLNKEELDEEFHQLLSE